MSLIIPYKYFKSVGQIRTSSSKSVNCDGSFQETVWILILLFNFHQLWLMLGFVFNQPDRLTICIGWPNWPIFSDVNMFPELSNYLLDYTNVLTDRINCQSYENKNSVLMNHSFPLTFHYLLNISLVGNVYHAPQIV